MPWDEADETDPLELVGVELPVDDTCHVEAARALAAEYAGMGFGEEALMALFHSPFYGGAHATYLALGEERVREIVRENVAFWGAVQFRVRDVDPASGLKLLPLIDSEHVGRRHHHGRR